MTSNDDTGAEPPVIDTFFTLRQPNAWRSWRALLKQTAVRLLLLVAFAICLALVIAIVITLAKAGLDSDWGLVLVTIAIAAVASLTSFLFSLVSDRRLTALTSPDSSKNSETLAGVPKDTLIVMADNSRKPVEAVKRGDVIKTLDNERHSEATAAVNDIVTESAREFVILNGYIKLPPSQQILCVGGYQPARQIQNGTLLLAESFQPIPVTSVTLQTLLVTSVIPQTLPPQQLYSLVIGADHGYFVQPSGSNAAVLIREGLTGKLGRP
jgi:hypothetical protein